MYRPPCLTFLSLPRIATCASASVIVAARTHYSTMYTPPVFECPTDAELHQVMCTGGFCRDLPAMLTYQLITTGAAKLSYIGHSQGTTIGMAFLASHAGTALAERIEVGPN